MPLPEATKEKIDAAVDAAISELRENIENWSAQDLLAWYKQSYMQATHKYLGRAMVALAKELGL